MKRYPVYKNSGVEWLGEIPEHWEVKRLKFLAKIKTGEKDTIDKVENGKYPFFVRSQTVERLNTYSYDEEAVLTAGDGVGVGKVFHYINGKFEYHQRVYKISEFKEILGKYFFYYIKNNLYAEVIKISAKSTVDSLRLPMFLNFPVSIPPLEEQKAIAHFLDHKLEQIEQYIRNKKRLIELLNEQKTAIINRAVTKGINPNVPMKHSGIEWLGEIPAHWETKRVKYITNILRGKFTHRPRNDPRMYDGKYPFIQTGDVASAKKYVTEYHQTLNEEGFAVSKQFPKGTLVMTIAANVGDMAILDFEACFPDSIVGFIPKEFMNLDYLYNLFLAMRQELFRITPMNTQLNLNVDRIGTLWAVVPPIQEQVDILQFIDNESKKIDKAIAQIEKEIELIQEYRTTLISDAVTGKIDVRGFDNGSNSKNSPKPPELATM